MKKLLIVLSIMVAMLSACDLFNSVIPFIEGEGETPPPAPSVEIPSITHDGDNWAFDFNNTITFSSATKDAKFYYTTNGTTPTTTSKSGSSMNLPSNGKNAYTVKVIAEKDGTTSMVTEKNFTKNEVGAVAIPEFVYEGNNAAFDFSSTITFTSATADATFY